jgi:hypothetical protein
MDFLTVQGFMKPRFMIVLLGALGFFTGVIIFTIDVLTLARVKVKGENSWIKKTV